MVVEECEVEWHGESTQQAVEVLLHPHAVQGVDACQLQRERRSSTSQPGVTGQVVFGFPANRGNMTTAEISAPSTPQPNSRLARLPIAPAINST